MGFFVGYIIQKSKKLKSATQMGPVITKPETIRIQTGYEPAEGNLRREAER